MSTIATVAAVSFLGEDEIPLAAEDDVGAGSGDIGHDRRTEELEFAIGPVHPVPVVSCIVEQLSCSVLFDSIRQVDGFIEGLEIGVREDGWVLSRDGHYQEHNHHCFKHMNKFISSI